MFSVSVLRDERIVIVAEQKPGATEEDAFTVSYLSACSICIFLIFIVLNLVNYVLFLYLAV